MRMRMLPRKRFSLRIFLTLAIVLVVYMFFSTVLKYDEIESNADEIRSRLLKERLAKYQYKNNEAENGRRSKVEAKFSNRYRFGSNNNNNDDAINVEVFADGANVANMYFNEDNLQQISRMHRLVHLDLKGSPPKLSYLKEFLPYIKSAGATGLIIEYDDFFPYSNDLESISNQNHYTSSELKQLFTLIKQSNFVVVPLVQTLDNLEFLLKLKHFAHLRESKGNFDLINPCLSDTYEKVLFKIVDQVIEAHPETMEYIHLGASRIREGLVSSQECKILNLSTAKDVYVYHLNRLAEHIKSRWPNLKILVWDDLLRKYLENEDDVNGSVHQLCKKIIPVVLNTHDFVDISTKVFKKYDQLSDEFWIASAYKGTSNELEVVPNAKRHYQNHLSWLNMISRLDNPFKLKGIVLTGRSRYDHMQGVCEILPAAVPSLTLSLQTIVNYDQTELKIFQDTKALTKCDYPKTLTGFLLDTSILLKHPFMDQIDLSSTKPVYNCQFPGSDLYNWLLNLKIITQHFEHKDLEVSHIFNAFNLKNKFFNPRAFDQAVNVFYPQVRAKLKDLMSIGEKEFDRVFYGDLYEELTNLYILRHLDTIDRRLVAMNKTTKPEFVPIRPLNKIEQTIL